MAIGAAIGATVIKAGGSYLAGKAASKAARRAAEGLETQFRESKAEIAPWRNVGEEALTTMAASLGLPGPDGRMPDGRDFSSFFKSPGYEFALGEGLKAVERGAAAGGMLQSGKTVKDTLRFAEGVAGQSYGSYIDRLGRVAGAGQNAATDIARMGMEKARGQAGLTTQAGQAKAAGYLGAADALTSGISGISELYGWKGGGAAGGGIENSV